MPSSTEAVHQYCQASLPRPLRAAGFTMLELMIVLSMVLAATTIAIPSMITVVANTRLRRGMDSLSSLYQNGRGLAVKQNTVTRVRFQVSDNNWVAYVDNGISPSGLTTSAPQLWMPMRFTKVSPPSGTSPAPLDAAACGSSIAPDTIDDTYFNQLGIPCQYSSGSCSASQSYAYYFNYLGSMNMSTTWAAMCISPAGRVRTWYWDGSAWKN
jgi:type II secretory pathway pseudopilin PulG